MFILCLFALGLSMQPNPPQWPSSVQINPSQSVIDSYYKRLGGNSHCCGVRDANGHFSQERVAFLFDSGYHNVKAKVGYYTSVIGLGDATIQGLVTNNGYSTHNGALSNFWRSVENIEISSSVTYAVSQASPMRGVTIQGDLRLSEGDGWSSGGFLADSTIHGNIYSGSQQQFFTRNTEFRSYPNGNWNMVFAGCPSAGSSTCGKKTVVSTVPIVAKKPYITKEDGRYKMIIPSVERDSLGRNKDEGQTVDFSYVYVANSGDLSGLRRALSDSTIMAVVLIPGIYKLEEPLRIVTKNFVLFGMGMANLIAPSGQSALIVAATGVRISGLLVEPSGNVQSNPLVMFGLKGQQMGSEDSPSFIHDVFTRVGRFLNSQPTRADIQLQVNMDWVIMDNIWLWRADHDIEGQVRNSMSPAYIGLQVNGDHVHGYGVAVEHNLQEQVQWMGEYGYVTFFQAELPYDVYSYNYPGYRVGSNVQNHEGHGMGCYSYFRDGNVHAPYGFAIPGGSGVRLENLNTVFLNGQGGSQIDHVINSEGNAAGKWNQGRPQYVCNPGPGPGPKPTPQPGKCTPMDNDPWSSGSYVNCCSGLVSCLKKWDYNRAPYYKCERSKNGCMNSDLYLLSANKSQKGKDILRRIAERPSQKI